MNRIFYDFQERISQVEFGKLYPGFKDYDFALYDDSKVYFKDRIIPWNEAFIGNTAINYQGRKIAIWNLKYAIDDLDVFASKIIHEMFHVFQLENNESRFPNEIDGLNYQYDEMNMKLKILETRHLIKAITEDDKSEFIEFLKIRKYRKDSFPVNLEYESKIETIEGVACFVELMALRQLSEKKYLNELKKNIELMKIEKNYIPIRTSCYHTGTFILICCLRFGYPINYNIEGNQTTHSDLLLDNISLEQCDEDLSDFNIDFIDEYFSVVKTKIDDIMDNAITRLEGDRITGLDPMNTVKLGEYYLSNHFIRINYEGTDENYFGETVVEILSEGVLIYSKNAG